jgi:hypothetical protein
MGATMAVNIWAGPKMYYCKVSLSCYGSSRVKMSMYKALFFVPFSYSEPSPFTIHFHGPWRKDSFCRRQVKRSSIRHRSFPPIRARKTDFPAGKFRPVKNLVWPMEACSVRPGPIKILSGPGFSSSHAARKQSSIPTIRKNASWARSSLATSPGWARERRRLT